MLGHFLTTVSSGAEPCSGLRSPAPAQGGEGVDAAWGCVLTCQEGGKTLTLHPGDLREEAPNFLTSKLRLPEDKVRWEGDKKEKENGEGKEKKKKERGERSLGLCRLLLYESSHPERAPVGAYAPPRPTR